MNTVTTLSGSGGYVMPSEQKRSESLRPSSMVLRNEFWHSKALRLCFINKYLSKFISSRYIIGRLQLGVTQELVGQRDQRFRSYSMTGSVLTVSSLA